MEKEKSIETSNLLIKGNIMCWEGTMIQLSNVSCISTTPLEQKEFPKLSMLLILVGCTFLTVNGFLALLLVAAGGAWIYYWYYTNEKRKSNTVLNIILNSGNNLCFVISEKSFLNQILHVLEQIIIEGGVGKQSVSIDMRGCKISGSANVLNDLNIS